MKSGKARSRQDRRAPARPRREWGVAGLQRKEVPRQQEALALDGDLVLCSSKHGIEPGAVVGQKDRWGVKLHHLQRKEMASECDSGTLG